MEQEYENKLLEKLNNIQGLSSIKDTILQYAKYVYLTKSGTIKNIGNCNVIIKCQEDYIDRKQLIDIILEILECSNAHYLVKRELSSEFLFKQLESNVFILDTIENRTNLRFNISELKYRTNNSKDKIFIVVSSEFNEEALSYIKENFTWYIETDIPTEKDKQNYIVSKLKENDIKISKSNKFVSNLAQEDLTVIDSTLLNIIIDCKLNDTKVVDDNVINKYKQNTDDDLDTDIKSNTKSALQQLDELIGLDDIKRQIHQIVNYVKVNKNRGKLPMLHMTFEGNAGSGKNEVARLIGRIFKEEGILPNGHFIEVSREDLVAGYVGQTALKTKEIIEKAKGGVLFIDEAYSLNPRDSGKDFGAECIITLIKAMEDNRDNLCVILAGYTEDMEQLLNANRGFKSRIQFRLKFNDYTADELYQIFKRMVRDDGYKLSSNVKSVLVEHFERAKQRDDFGNGRYVRSLFEKVKFELTDRLVADDTVDVNTITKADIINVIGHLDGNIPKERNRIGFVGVL